MPPATLPCRRHVICGDRLNDEDTRHPANAPPTVCTGDAFWLYYLRPFPTFRLRSVVTEVPDDRSHQDSPSLCDWQLIAPFALLVGFQVFGAFVNDNDVWGINLWSVFPSWSVIVAACGYALLSVPSISLGLYRGIAASATPISHMVERFPRWINWTIVTVLFAAVAWVLRSRALIYGDGFVVVSISDRPLSGAFATLHDYYRPLTTLLQQASQALRHAGVDSKETVFWVMQVVVGVVGWLGLVRLVRSVTEESNSRAIIFLTALTSGCVVLLLGWVEMYVLPLAMLLWLLASAIRYVKHNGSVWPVGILGLLAVLSSALVAPVTIMILLFALKLRGEFTLAKLIPNPRILFLLVILFAIGAGVAFNLLTQVNFVVPLLATPMNPYWTLSPRHLADLANLMLFVAPALLSFLILMTLYRGDRRWLKEPTTLLIGLAGLTCLLVSFWLNPVLGAPCDWDLLSFFGFPLSLAAGYALTKMVTDERQRRLLAIQLVLVAAVLAVPNIYEKTHLDVAVKRIEPLIWNDVHYQPTYFQARRCISFGSILHHNCGQTRTAEKYFRRRVQAKPDCDLGWYNFGVVLFAQQKYSPASECFARAVELNPTVSEYRASFRASVIKERE